MKNERSVGDSMVKQNWVELESRNGLTAVHRIITEIEDAHLGSGARSWLATRQ